MTFTALVATVMERMPVTLTSADAAARIGRFINQRYRQVQTSVSMEKTRRTTINVPVVSGSNFTTVSGVAKLLDLYDPDNNWVLNEYSLDQLRNFDPTSDDAIGNPQQYAIYKHTNDEIELYVYPRPNVSYDLQADAVAAGDEMSGSDEPALPTDFHDVLVWGALADECSKQEKFKLLETYELKFQARLNELRYFIAKSAYLSLQQTDNYLRFGFARKIWPYSGY